VRLDVQGLRALAVVAVVVNHAIGWPVGGFLGVDVFFVVSGFLITGLLVRDLERTGRISFGAFYRRRVRRILPNALLVLTVTVAAAWLLFPAARFREVLTDGAWAALFSANIHFLAQGTDYFSASGPPSPLQHFWSLGVEEQFYLVWPLLLLVIAVVASGARRRSSLRVIAAITISVVVIASLGWALAATATDPTSAYFSTLTRAWELGVGALLAVIGPSLQRLPASVRPLIAWCGTAVIAASLLLIPGTVGVPAPAVVPAVLGTALVLAADAPSAANRLLTNRAAVRLGDLSYSLYLWHLPVLVLGAALLPAGPVSAAVLVVVALLLAVAAYLGVERPFRSASRRPPRRAVVIGGAAALALVATVASIPLPVSHAAARPAAATAVPSTAAPAPRSPTASVVPSIAPDPAVALTAQIRAALRASSWPALHPDVPSVGLAARVPEWTKDNCLVVTSRNEAGCRWGTATAGRSAIVLGDSVALSWVPAIRTALEPLGYRVQALTMAQCPAAAVPVTDVSGSTSFADQCTAHNDWTIAQVRELKPQLVILASTSTSESRIIGAGGPAVESRMWRAGQAALLRRLPAGVQAAVLDGPPREDSLLDCDSRGSTPAACVTPVPSTYRDFTRDEAAGARAAGAAHIQVRSWFCTAGKCPAFVGPDAVFADGEHLTGPYSKRLGPVLAAALIRAGLQVQPPVPGSATGATH
jgi:peptidoglycan/LPS O-acetylase OafA/YrhL